MPLDQLSMRSDSAAANMAADFLLLQHYPDPARARWRHYQWHRPAVTFGYAQKIKEVQARLEENVAELDLCRRPTGGGIVDHRDDWTYALVIPAQHDLGAARAAESYTAVHQVLAATLKNQGCAAMLQPAETVATAEAGPAVCFTRAEPADVIHATSGLKIAGAAQKRSKRGLLFQGSIAQSVAGDIDWDQFEAEFGEALAKLLQETLEPCPWPEPWDEMVDALAEDYTSDAWIARR